MEAEFDDYEKNNKWNHIYQKIKLESLHDFGCKEAKKNENKSFNRYRDVMPYDHSRVVLERTDNKYINASLIQVNEADRAYILTQGPLPTTTGHFWLMVWEQKSKAIIMLNRLVESGHVKCHLYWPNGKHNDDTDELILTEVQLKVQFLTETKHQCYVIRKFLLTDLETGESREIFHYHYIAWPDFGVPESPGSFLQFLLAVRQSGSLERSHGPSVVHCSAGIGRSGTFALIDSCLVMIEKNGSLDCINIIDVLLDMRHYRMGLIQTHEQLRFSYQVIIEGSKLLLKLNNANDNNVPLNANNNSTEFKPHLPKTIERLMGISEDDDNDNEDDNIVNNELCSLPPLPTKYRRSHSTTSQSSTSPEPESDKKLTTQNLISFNQDEDNTFDKERSNNISNEEKVENINKKKEQELRQRIREEKKKKTEETIERMKRKQKQAEARSNSKRKKK